MLPTAVQPLLDFTTVLRRHGFSISPDQSISFIEAVEILGPRDIWDIRSAARAILSIPKEREPEFDALFRAVFFGQTVAADTDGEADDVEALEPTGETMEVESGDEMSDVGLEAVAAERLGQRPLVSVQDETALDRFAKLAPQRLPRRRSYRRAPARRGDALDLRRTLKQAVRRDGEVFELCRTRRKTRQRKILLLIDVSGSMKERTDEMMRFAHALAKAADRLEVFTLGTRLTRITSTLSVADRDLALKRVEQAVADIDGGTRIGDALQAFLAVPRYAGFARGAAVVVLSDGLERGNPDAMVDAVRRISRLAWRVEWLTPLAGDPQFEPQTAALSAILPWLDSLADGGAVERVCRHILNIARAA